MNQHVSILNNEKGSAIVFALLALAALTIIGISSTNISITELGIVRNEQIYQTNFYLAESSAYEGALHIEKESDPLQLIPDTSEYNWLNDDATDFTVATNWNDVGQGSNDATDNSDPSQFDTDTIYSTVAKGVRKGSSLSLGASRLYDFSVFGKSETNNGNAVIEIGYLKRF